MDTYNYAVTITFSRGILPPFQNQEFFPKFFSIESLKLTMSNTLRQDIIFKILKLARDNSDLSSDELFKQAESETLPMFDKLVQSNKENGSTIKDDKARTKRRMKRKDRNQRKEHVGRFFIRLMEKNIRKPGIPDCLIPVFATSVQSTIGEEAYAQVAEKIGRLLDFGEKKGYDYDQVLDSKPGKTIATEIVTLYRAEMGSASFEKLLKNNLDKTLVQNISSIENGQELNIEDTINLAFDEFIKYLSAS